MLNLKNITNINVSEIEDTIFDLGIFASGYETRSTSLARKLSFDNILNCMILGFSEHRENKTRIINDNFYLDKKLTPIIVSSNDEKVLYQTLKDVFNTLDHNKVLKILIDYTSMSRLWYSGVLNFIKFQKDLEIEVYLNYSLGKYTHKIHNYFYNSINSLPSHEGSLAANTRTLLVLGIGFYPELAQSIIEEIEPNDIIGILPIPSLKKEYDKKSIQSKEYLNQDITKWIKCPIDNLEVIFRTYAEIISNNISKKDIIFLSLGPKIFTLASILVGQRFEQITCLYLKSKQNDMNDIKATGDYICNKIIYK